MREEEEKNEILVAFLCEMGDDPSSGRKSEPDAQFLRLIPVLLKVLLAKHSKPRLTISWLGSDFSVAPAEWGNGVRRLILGMILIFLELGCSAQGSRP